MMGETPLPWAVEQFKVKVSDRERAHGVKILDASGETVAYVLTGTGQGIDRNVAELIVRAVNSHVE